MSSKLKRKLIVFNEDDAHQRELLEWVASRTNNFSGFVKDVLFAFMTGGSGATAAVAIEVVPVAAPPAAPKKAWIGEIF